jgi:hypothetical protein
MTTPSECVTVHLYRSSSGEWGLIITTDHTADHYWPKAHGVPTQLERAEALQALGYEVVSRWVWQEWPTKPETHSLQAFAHVARIVHPVPEPWKPNGGHEDSCAYVAGISRRCTCSEVPA